MYCLNGSFSLKNDLSMSRIVHFIGRNVCSFQRLKCTLLWFYPCAFNKEKAFVHLSHPYIEAIFAGNILERLSPHLTSSYPDASNLISACSANGQFFIR